MKNFFNLAPVFAEINPACLRLLCETGGVEIPLQRASDGKLTPACRKTVVAELRNFLGRQRWQPRVRAVCGISGHGVSLRKISLPSGAVDVESIIRLQIEKEFPLAPEDLAWGWQKIPGPDGPQGAVVAAVRRQVITDYAELFSEAGAHAEFTLSAFARELLCPPPGLSHAQLDAQTNYFELVLFDGGLPASIRIFSAISGVVEALRVHSAKVVYLSGTAPKEGIWEQLPAQVERRPVDVPAGPGASAATLGLKKAFLENAPLLILQAKSQAGKTPFNFSRADFFTGSNRQWITRAGALLLLLVLLPFAEALVFKPLLALKLNSFKSRRQRFVSVVNPELQFLLSLKQAQPPYLDALYVMAQAAPPGFSITSLSMDETGDVALKATVQNAQQVMDFRARLIASGFFATITVEDQTPSPHQPKLDVRISAQWKAGARAVVKIPPPNETSGSADAQPPGALTRL